MDKEKIRSEVLDAIRQVLSGADGSQDRKQPNTPEISENDVIAELGIESLEMIALTQVLEQRFNLGYIEVETIKNLTVGQLCNKVVYHNLRAEVKKEMLKILHKLDEHTDYSGACEEERIFWDWEYDSMDIAELALEIEHKFGVDLSGLNLSDYTFGEVIDCITERL